MITNVDFPDLGHSSTSHGPPDQPHPSFPDQASGIPASIKPELLEALLQGLTKEKKSELDEFLKENALLFHSSIQGKWL